MLRNTLIALLASTAVNGQRWVETFVDDFNGNSLDRSKWTVNVGNGGFGNNELQYYTDRSENIEVHDGNLHIIARKENYGGN